MGLGWWLQLIGMVLAIIGFVISPKENIVKSAANINIKGIFQFNTGSGDIVGRDKNTTIINPPANTPDNTKDIQEILRQQQELITLQKRSKDGVLQTKFIDPKKEIFIKMGSNGLKTNYADISNGYSLRPGSFYKVEGPDPVSIQFKNGKLSIDAWIMDERKAMIANIISNTWKVPPSKKYDINYDPGAFELYDVDRKLPIVQIQVKDDNVISVSGIFNYRNGTQVVISPGDLMSDNPPEPQLSEMQDQLRAARIFTYPSEDNIGVRNPNYTEIRNTKSRE